MSKYPKYKIKLESRYSIPFESIVWEATTFVKHHWWSGWYTVEDLRANRSRDEVLKKANEAIQKRLCAGCQPTAQIIHINKQEFDCG